MVVGCDGAGVIESVGSNVKDFTKGDRVFFQINFDTPDDTATFQQYALADPKIIGRTPKNVTDEQASTFPTSLATAVVSLYDKTGIVPPLDGPTANNEPIVILGGSGSMGRAIIQLARITGFSPIITTCSKAHTEDIKSLGATHVFERTVSTDEIYSVLQESGKPLRLVIDSVSLPETQVFAYNLLANQPNAPPADELHLQNLLPPAEELVALNAARAGGPIKVQLLYGVASAFKELNEPFFAAAGRWLEEGKLVPGKVQLVEGGLKSVPRALDIIAKGVSGVKLVIRPQE